ncbi:MAG: alanine dehydrogenase, partial [Mariniphaga sp.]|nr:alanine dehydrogenase [Mariniphaga sp.]
VDLLTSYGHEVFIEQDAGKMTNYSDDEYRAVGAYVVESKEETFQCDIILRIAPFDYDEINSMRGNQVLFSNMQIQAQSSVLLQKMIQKKITAIAYENIENEQGFLPFVHQMSQIAGATAITLASEYLSNTRNGKGVLFGEVTGITPSELVIIGTSTAAEYAARAALSLGVLVKVFDTSVYNLSKLEDKLGRRIFTSVFYPMVLRKALLSADAVIGAMQFNTTPKYKVSEDLIKVMKEGSVIIDLNAGQGGCFETTRCTDLNNPVYLKHGVVHYCVPNSPAIVARTASIALSNNLLPLLLAIGDSGGVHNYIKNFRGFRKGVYLYSGILTNHELGRLFNLPSKDIDLLMSVF